MGSDFQTPFFFLSEFHLVTVKIWRQIDEGDKFWQKFEKLKGQELNWQFFQNYKVSKGDG